MQPIQDTAVCTLATEESWKDLKVFLFSLNLFNNPEKITVFILCDDFIDAQVKESKFFTGKIVCVPSLQKYIPVNRNVMERTKGLTYKTKWEDFMMEKATVMNLAFENNINSVFFSDSDICFMGPLPIVPKNITLALCPHMINERSQTLYGKYNAGFLWTNNKDLPEQWRKASHTSRYYDQAALEDLAARHNLTLHEFPSQVNYGWWRMFQAPQSASTLQNKWTVVINSPDSNSGINVENKPLLSIHTHLFQLTDINMGAFNQFMIDKLMVLKNHVPASNFLKFLANELKIDNL
jgi:hypothetical protein